MTVLSSVWCVDWDMVDWTSCESYHEDVNVSVNATCVGHLDDKVSVPKPTNHMKTKRDKDGKLAYGERIDWDGKCKSGTTFELKGVVLCVHSRTSH